MPGSEICSSAIENVERRISVETKLHRTEKRPPLKAGRRTPHLRHPAAAQAASMPWSGQAKDALMGSLRPERLPVDRASALPHLSHHVGKVRAQALEEHQLPYLHGRGRVVALFIDQRCDALDDTVALGLQACLQAMSRLKVAHVAHFIDVLAPGHLLDQEGRRHGRVALGVHRRAVAFAQVGRPLARVGQDPERLIALGCQLQRQPAVMVRAPPCPGRC